MTLHLKTGSMRAGKTTQLIKDYIAFKQEGKSVCIINYIGDIERNKTEFLKSHDNIMVECLNIESFDEEKLQKYMVTFDGHIAELDRIKELALKKGSFSSAVNAETNRGKAAGLYIDRKIIKTGKLEDLSEQELEAKMRQILSDYSQIIDVTPSKSSESSLPSVEESSSDHQK